MQWRFRWAHRLMPGVRAYIGSRSASVRLGVPDLGITTGTADTRVSGEVFPDSDLFWSQKIDGLSGAVVVFVVFALVFAVVFAVLMGFALMGAFVG